MKRTIIASVTGICLLLGIAFGAYMLSKGPDGKSTGGDLSKTEQTGKAEKSAFGLYERAELKGKTKKIQLLGKEKLLTYKYTDNNSDLSVEKRADSYKTQDIFEDAENNQYEFLYNTDVLCRYAYRGITEPKTDETVPSAITNEEIIKKCDSYLKKLYPDNQYRSGEVFRNQSALQYGALYYYYLGDMKTDDVFLITFENDGTLRSFAAYNLNRYEKFENSKLNLERAKENFNEKTKGLEYDEFKEQIKLTDSGELVIEYRFTVHSDGTPEVKTIQEKLLD